MAVQVLVLAVTSVTIELVVLLAYGAAAGRVAGTMLVTAIGATRA